MLLVIVVAGFTISFNALGVADNYWLSFFAIFMAGFVGEGDAIEFEELVNADIGRALYVVLIFFLVVVCLNAM